jgi:NAD(P)H-flavin reductase
MADEFRRVTVTRAWSEGPRLKAFELDAPVATHAAPGQFVRARVPGSPREAFFALANAPGNPLELLVQRSEIPDAEPPDPRGSRAADEIYALESGAALEMTAPAGKGFPIAAEAGRDVLLLAGGSGISAIRSALEYVAGRRSDFGKTWLLFGARRIEDLAYRSLFDGWSRERIDVVPTLSRAAAGTWSGRQGYVQAAVATLGIDAPRTSAFLAGGKEFIAAVTGALTGLGVAPDRIFKNF